MTGAEFSNNDPVGRAHEALIEANTMLRRAATIAEPNNPNRQVAEVFPNAREIRAQGQPLELSTEQNSQLSQIGVELGMGRKEDVMLSELGLYGAVAVIEGGQPHKMMAEAQLVADDDMAHPAMIIFAGSPHRVISDETEIDSGMKLFGRSGTTEYDNARLVAESLADHWPLTNEQDLPFRYDISHNFSTKEVPSGQFKEIGILGDSKVVLMAIDRENYLDESGEAKYRNQPDTADVIEIVAEFSDKRGYWDTPIAFVSSPSYPSRRLDAIRAGLITGRTVEVATYGDDRLRAIKGELIDATVAPNPNMAQLPGELHRMVSRVNKLDETLRNR